MVLFRPQRCPHDPTSLMAGSRSWLTESLCPAFLPDNSETANGISDKSPFLPLPLNLEPAPGSAGAVQSRWLVRLLLQPWATRGHCQPSFPSGRLQSPAASRLWRQLLVLSSEGPGDPPPLESLSFLANRRTGGLFQDSGAVLLHVLTVR